MNDIIFLDTETSGVDQYYDQIWELSATRIAPDGTETHLDMFIHHDQHLINALPQQFREDHDRRFDPTIAVRRMEAAHIIHTFIGRDKPHLCGLNPAFDAGMIANHYHVFGYIPNWNYHLLDLEAMAVGWLAANGDIIELPFKSDDLARRIGINPDDFDRHTARGDVDYARAWWNAMQAPGKDS